MTKFLQNPNSSAEIFLKNISNLVSIIILLDMIELEYIGHEDQKEIISQVKIQFENFCRKITSEIEAMNSKNVVYRFSLDSDELFSTRKILNSANLISSKPLIILKEKIEDMVNFVLMIEKNLSAINLTEDEKIIILQEVFITRNRIYNLQIRNIKFS